MTIEGYEKISNNYETLIATLIAHQNAHQTPALQKIQIKKTVNSRAPTILQLKTHFTCSINDNYQMQIPLTPRYLYPKRSSIHHQLMLKLKPRQ